MSVAPTRLLPGNNLASLDTGGLRANAKKSEIAKVTSAPRATQIANKPIENAMTTNQKRTNVRVSISMRTFIPLVKQIFLAVTKILGKFIQAVSTQKSI